MKNMKLILENWKRSLSEQEAQDQQKAKKILSAGDKISDMLARMEDPIEAVKDAWDGDFKAVQYQHKNYVATMKHVGKLLEVVSQFNAKLPDPDNLNQKFTQDIVSTIDGGQKDLAQMREAFKSLGSDYVDYVKRTSLKEQDKESAIENLKRSMEKVAENNSIVNDKITKYISTLIQRGAGPNAEFLSTSINALKYNLNFMIQLVEVAKDVKSGKLKDPEDEMQTGTGNREDTETDTVGPLDNKFNDKKLDKYGKFAASVPEEDISVYIYELLNKLDPQARIDVLKAFSTAFANRKK